MALVQDEEKLCLSCKQMPQLKDVFATGIAPWKNLQELISAALHGCALCRYLYETHFKPTMEKKPSVFAKDMTDEINISLSGEDSNGMNISLWMFVRDEPLMQLPIFALPGISSQNHHFAPICRRLIVDFSRRWKYIEYYPEEAHSWQPYFGFDLCSSKGLDGYLPQESWFMPVLDAIFAKIDPWNNEIRLQWIK